MFNPPKTIEEARAYRYRVWAGNPEGMRYKEGYCVESVPDGGRSVLSHQCGNKATVGLYCSRHNPEARKRRDAARAAKWKREIARSPAVRADRYREALEKIAAIPNATNGGDWDEIEQAREIARKALEDSE